MRVANKHISESESESESGHDIFLHKKCANWRWGVNKFWSDKNIWTHLGGSLTSN